MVKTVCEGFFFQAMVAGYAGGVSPTPVANMPGYKEIRYVGSYQGTSFLLVDRWCKNRQSGMSDGTTVIYHCDDPVWIMHYNGRYPTKTVTAFLKEALKQSYLRQEFVGGRGPYAFSDKAEGLVYVNHPRLNDFDRFEGREEIVALYSGQDMGAVVGYHEYWGMSLS